MRYIVAAGSKWYPDKGAKDWQGVYDNHDDAIAKAKSLTDDWVRIIHLHPDGTYFEDVWR